MESLYQNRATLTRTECTGFAQKAYEDPKEYGKSFDHILEGNR